MKYLTAILVATLLSSVVFAAPKSTDKLRASVRECMNNDASTMGMRACIAEGQETASKMFNAAQNEARKNASSNKEVLKRFNAAQNAWFKFEEAQCSYESSDMLGGTGEALIADSCSFNMTLDRIDSLKGESSN